MGSRRQGRGGERRGGGTKRHRNVQVARGQGTGKMTAKEWRHPSLYPLHGNSRPADKPRTIRCRYTKKHTGIQRRRHKGDRVTHNAKTPPGGNRYLGAGQGRKGGGGGGGRRECRQKQARGAGIRDEWLMLAGGVCGQRTGVQRSATIEEVGSGCYK